MPTLDSSTFFCYTDVLRLRGLAHTGRGGAGGYPLLPSHPNVDTRSTLGASACVLWIQVLTPSLTGIVPFFAMAEL